MYNGGSVCNKLARMFRQLIEGLIRVLIKAVQGIIIQSGTKLTMKPLEVGGRVCWDCVISNSERKLVKRREGQNEGNEFLLRR